VRGYVIITTTRVQQRANFATPSVIVLMQLYLAFKRKTAIKTRTVEN
jgi:hypothetical protein